MSEFDELLKGMSIRQITLLLDVEREALADMIRDAGIQPSGKRGGNPIYLLSEVAPHVVQSVAPLLAPGDSTKLATRIQRKNASTEKDYWDAQLKRQKFMEQAGDLWRTEKLIDTLAGIFKHLRESIVVFLDSMEHESGLPVSQIEKTKAFGDALLQGMHDKLTSLNVPTEGDHDYPDGGDPPPTDDDFLKSVGLA